MKFILILFLTFLSFLVVAQKQSDSQLAYNYYQNKEYAKAADLYLQLYQRTKASYYLDYHIICLINAKEYEKAETTLKKFLKTDDNNKDFLVNLGYIYQQQGKIKKSTEYYEKALKKLIPHNNDIQNLAYKFRNIREYEWATKTYLKGRELLKKPDAFILEMGDNYMMERNYEAMFDQFVLALMRNPGNINNITSKLNFARNYDVNNNVDTVIRSRLKAIFQEPDYPAVFDELTVWFALQTNDYAKALEHAVSLNSKAENKLNAYITIAREATRSGRYDVAEDSYRKVIEKGKEKNDFYYTARKEILSCRNSAYHRQKPDTIKYKELVRECEKYISETGYINSNSGVLLLMADICAYQLHLPDSAVSILLKGETIRRLPASDIFSFKSKRADILAFTNNPWEATILYTQIEKANPNNDIGYEAKLKKGWMAYYEGDLLWAKAQFDVLKGATSKLISNDAIKMSHFINSNYEEGGDNSGLEKLAKTEYLLYRQQYKEALPLLDSIIGETSGSMADYASLLKARFLLSQGEKTQAGRILENIKNNSEETYIRAEAIFQLAGLKSGTHQKEEALDLYKLLVSDYSGSVYSVEAGKIYRELEKQ